jgi:hypothetical protein
LLHAALRLREKYPESKILVLEKECYLMERALRMLVLPALKYFIIDDLKSHLEEEVFNWLQKGGRTSIVTSWR